VETLRTAIRHEPTEMLGSIFVKECVLMQSQLDPTGSIYTALEHFPLGAA